MSAVFKRACVVILIGAVVLFLLTSLTGCARSPAAPVVILPVKCEHPEIAPYSSAGLVEAVTLYHRAIETCNALNGHGVASEPQASGHAEAAPATQK